MALHDQIKKLQQLPESKKKIIFFSVVIIAGLIMGSFWFKNTVNTFNNLSKSGQALELPDVTLPNEINEAITDTSNDAQTADWQIYTDENYGFEIKHPNNWITESDNQEESSIVRFLTLSTKENMENNTLACNNLDTISSCNPDGIPPEVSLYISSKNTTPATQPQEQMNFNGYPFTSYQGAFAGEQHYTTSYNNKNFDFICIDQEICRQMLSTFKFLNPKS